MEERVGEIWHNFITRLADKNYPDAEVELVNIKKTIGIFFRALGGDGSLSVAQTDESEYTSERSFLKRIARSSEKYEFAWIDENSLRLPKVIDYFPTKALNKDLYLWLAALASISKQSDSWIIDNQLRTQCALAAFPGLKNLYQRLLTAHLEQRPELDKISKDEQKTESIILQALNHSGSVVALPKSKYMPRPVTLWLHPNPPNALQKGDQENLKDSDNQRTDKQKDATDIGKKQAKRVDSPDEVRGLITVRMENLFTWGEFANMDRSTDDDEDPENAKDVAKDLDELAIARNQRASKVQMKFDLDLPSEAMDDEILEEGILLPEWDWKKQELIQDKCQVVNMVSTEQQDTHLPDHLKATAKKLRNQFQAITPARTWHYAQSDGQEVDMEAYLKFKADLLAGQHDGKDNFYKELSSGARDLSCLLLADLSLSTDTWVNNDSRVIDVIQDSLYLFAESLNATGDRFGMIGFSSRKTNPIRIHTLKTFDEKYNGKIRSRIAQIKPGYYTRMGAGIRHAANLLKEQVATQQLLLILTDGKPNDLDMYEGRYGIEDTKQAILSARAMGLKVFCVTIDEKGNDYLPNLFGTNGYALVRKVTDLPKTLPMLYARLTL
ncbi:nitric oxide reductase activation protein NorD [Candidatus Thioglobus autotrophicus]|uniref:nitric oxide reductase activation protein NorD n=1 Tax=Candidatus Thioglobus autotrophicus TaxID=1705394 RepID=UPI00299D3469|nr:VWA domain-containing protein [Candidatus Thioglobus autotrophicus]WPE18062.1 VWA domain-containing protein [Candidatus Thioglobus autotrophicus]